MNKIGISNTLWEVAKNFGVIQDEVEYKEFVKFLLDSDLKFDNCLEIGIFTGGMIPLYCSLFSNVYGLDSERRGETIGHLERTYPNFKFLQGMSDSYNILEYIKTNNLKFDMIMIDADHLYDAVKRDYELYKDFVSDNGIIVFHDIKTTNKDINAYCDVDVFWKELITPTPTYNNIHQSPNYVEISNISTIPVQHNIGIVNNRPPNEWGGIGILYNRKG